MQASQRSRPTSSRTMHFYSRSRPNATPTPGTLPAGVFGTDGSLSLGIPVRSRAGAGGSGAPNDRSTRTDPLSALAADATPSAGVTVLMFPGAPDAEEAPRAALMLTLLCDVAALVAMLYELHWRTVHVDFLLGVGISGLLVDVLGVGSGLLRGPSLLGLFAVGAMMQLFSSALPSVSLAQCVHTAIQPLLVWNALTLRRARLPLWFSTGRVR